MPRKDTDTSKQGQSAKAAFTAMVCKDITKTSSKSWFIDSGGSRHMTFDVSRLENLKTTNVEDITVANNDVMKVSNVGDTTLRLSNNNIPMRDVLHVPNLGVNLLSVSQIVSKGNVVLFDETGCTIKNREGMTVLHTKCENGVYKISETSEMCALANNSMTWHRKLGHMNINSLRRMREGAVDGVDFKDNGWNEIQNCEICSEGKMTRPSFKSSETRATRILEIIHSDVNGPMETQSIGKAKYFLTFVDDYSRKTFVYFLKQKSEVLEKFKEFKAMVENQTGKKIQLFVDNVGDEAATNPKIKKLRSDNGGEYISKDFIDFCKMHGIQHQFTNAYSPQQNGVAERMNRTLTEKARCLLFDAKLTKTYWAEAINMATYIVNKSVNSKGNVSPDELYDGKKPNLTNLKIFGTEVMVHVPKEKRRKWEQRAKKLIFVGYADDVKGYRCIDPKTRLLTLSRDVKFLNEPAKVIFDLQNTNNKHFEGKDTIESSERNTNDDSIPGQDESVIIIEDSIYEEANESSNDDETLYDNPNDPDYEPSEETLNEAESEVANDYSPKKGKRKKVIINPLNLTNYAFFVEPQSFEEATSNEDAQKWTSAIKEEMKSHELNNTWTLTDLPNEKKAIKSKWVFKLKRDQNGEISRYKARIVVKGCSQKQGIDYTETFSPVVRYTSLRFLFALTAKYGTKCYQLDAITAFIQGEVDEQLYMEQPPGFNDGTGRVCKLNRALYGLKQAGRLWNLKLDAALNIFGLKKCKSDPCIYMNKERNLIVAIYVDDFLIFYDDENKLNELKSYLNQKFMMKDVGPIESCLGMRIKQSNFGIELDQEAYINDILSRFGMENSKPVNTPSDTHEKLTISMVTSETSLVGKVPYQEAVGSLLFLAQCTRPDIAFAVNDVSRFNANHGEAHWRAVKRIFRYLKGTANYKLTFSRSKKAFHCYSDADWASDIDKRRSCTGQVIIMSNGAISWQSKRQATVALSSTEAEYMAMSSAICEIIWMQQLASELDKNFKVGTTLLCDNESAQKLSLSDAYRPRTKHIDIRYHHMRQKIEDGVINIEHVATTDNVADALTKAVSKDKVLYCAKGMGLF